MDINMAQNIVYKDPYVEIESDKNQEEAINTIICAIKSGYRLKQAHNTMVWIPIVLLDNISKLSCSECGRYVDKREKFCPECGAEYTGGL